jgi:hypothetical protein
MVRQRIAKLSLKSFMKIPQSNTLAQRQAVRDLALKLKFERQLAIKMRTMFREISRTVKHEYLVEGRVPLQLNQFFEVDLEGTLRKHYRKVAKRFKNRLKEQVIKSIKPQYLEMKSTAVLEKAITDYIHLRSRLQTQIISTTTQKEILKAYSETAFDGSIQTREEYAAEAAFAFERRALGRADTIGLTETQNIAEKTKDLEAQYFFQENELVAGGIAITEENAELLKTWSAILDKVTRPTHVEADDQTVPQEDPFIVGDSQLMFPGDTSLGASLDEIINCRCNRSTAVRLSGLPEYVRRPEGHLIPEGFAY